MPDNTITIKVEGLEKIEQAINKFPREISKYVQQAGQESFTRVIAKTPGMGVGKDGYPPIGPWNQPPEPYYIRHRGTQTKSGNTGGSEDYGTQWYVKKVLSGFATEIGNRASYAKYLASENPVRWAKSHGWKQLFSTAKEKKGDITKVYQAWVNKLIRDLGL